MILVEDFQLTHLTIIQMKSNNYMVHNIKERGKVRKFPPDQNTDCECIIAATIFNDSQL